MRNMCNRQLLVRTSIFPHNSLPNNYAITRASNLAVCHQKRGMRYERGISKHTSSSNWWQKVIGVGAAGYTVVKLKGLTFLVPALKFAKMGPLLSMGASMAAYGWLFGWPFGVGMVSLIFVHELGHGLAMRALGVPAGPMTFIPFFGAVIEMKGRPSNAYHDALIAIAGPILGTAATMPLLAIGLSTGSQFALALSHWGCMVNLFNLLPIGMLDGGRIAGSLSKWTLPVGIGLSGVGIYAFPHNPIMYLTALSACASTYSRFYGSESHHSDFYKLDTQRQLIIGGMYIGLIVFLASAMQLNDTKRKSPAQLRSDLGLHHDPDSEYLFAWIDENSWTDKYGDGRWI